jgi:MFS family permease
MFKQLDRNLLLLFALNIAFGLTMQLINPLFPLFLEEAGANEVQNAMVISAGNLVATLFMLPSGLLIDRVGKKTLLLIGAGLSTVSIFLLSTVNNWVAVFPLYMLLSMAGAFFIPSRMAMITENTDPSNRSSTFGVMNMAWPVTGIIAPTLSGFLVQYFSWRHVFLIAGGINALSLIPTYLIKRKEAYKTKKEKTSFRDVFGREVFPTLASFFLFHLFMTTGLGGVNMILPLYLEDVHGLSPTLIGIFFTAPSVVMMFTQVPAGTLAERFGKKRWVLSCIVLIPFLYLSWFLTENWVVMLIAYSLLFGLWSMTWPATLTLLSESVPEEILGAAFGVRMTGVRMGFTVGPLIGSYLYSTYYASSPFLGAAGFTLLAVIIAYTLQDYVREN